MTTRRTFIKTLAVLPPALSLGTCWAAGAELSRVALVIGNGAYRDAPLANPTNDARAVGNLLTQAGFSVDARINAAQIDMLAAIDAFGAAAQRPETKLVLFYYAGHGAQLDWRNYLLPVDAVVETAEQMKQRCVDLTLLLGKLSSAKDKTFVVILDACRNNPFGTAYRPEQKGLSQFDAPVGSLLAYATSPGNVASDGAGGNGLYTENLVRELSNRASRIEDALKRVRLNVRLASRGEQIPWETTSLESDVYIFNDSRNKPGEAETEQQIEADIATWEKIKSSRKIEDWAGYLRHFPNGRFAEIAQMRLTRLLAAVEPAQPAGVKPAAAASQTLSIDENLAAPALIAPANSPYSSGLFPLGRVFTVGDRARYVITDRMTGIQERKHLKVVTRVDLDEDRVEFSDGDITDLMGNYIKNGNMLFDVPVQWAPAELQVGKKWTAAFRRTRNGEDSNAYYDITITKRESVTVPAGTFDTFKAEGYGRNKTLGARLERTLWLVPGLNFAVKRESIARNKKGQLMHSEVLELAALQQHTFRKN